MRRIISYFTLSLALCQASAQAIECTSGNLSSLVSDNSITQLTVTGTMDARDFSFIANDLKQLTSINLQDVEIEAVDTQIALFGNMCQYEAATLPNSCFASSNISSFILPQTLKVIGEGAFLGCQQLQSIVLPQQLDSIGDYAFSACQSLESITLPASTTIVGTGAFSHCTALKSLSVTEQDRTATLSIGNQAFLNCSALAQVQLSSYTTTIGEEAFCGCSDETFAIDFGAESQFSNMGKAAFMNCGISSFNFTQCPKLTVIPAYAFANSQITSIAIPSNITHIGEGAFFYDANLADINLGNCSSSISPLQFAGCTAASGTGLDSSSNEVGNYAYYGWNQSQKLVLPSNVIYIGDRAFANWNSLTSVVSKNTTPPQLGEEAFGGITLPNVALTTHINAQGYTTTAVWQDFSLTLNGDADSNKQINVNDLTAIISHTTGKTAANFTFETADSNLDDAIDNTDINYVINSILYQDNNSVQQ
ncbi:MAG: leucine-rich repeat protein [Muribaculaceae bacterium]